MNPIQAYPASGVVVPNHGARADAPEAVNHHHDGTHAPEVLDHPAHGVYAPELGNKTGAEYYVSSENDSHNGGIAAGNEVLERDAQTKGRWFQYVKTKQFWITLVVGQGTFVLVSISYGCGDFAFLC